MREIYLMLVVGVLIGLLICTHFLRKNPSEMARLLYRIVLVGCFASVSNGFAVLANEELLATFLYGCHFVGITWILYCLYDFIKMYTKVQQDNLVIKRIFLSLTIVDSVSILCNMFLHHHFIMERVLLQDSHYMYTFQMRSGFIVHLILCYSMVAFVMGSLLYKCFTTPRFYRKRYIVLSIAFLCLVIVNILFLATEQLVVDPSLLLYPITAIILFYATIYYVPHLLMENLLVLVSQNIEMGVICFDSEGKRIFRNDAAEKIYQRHGDEKVIEYFGKWRNQRDLGEIQQESFVEKIEEKGQEYVYEVQFNKLEDKTKNYLGSYFSILDRTEEMLALEAEQYRSSHDGLTGLLNQPSFYAETKKLLEAKKQQTYYMVCSDVKDFKSINEVFGMDVGDEILKSIARLIMENMQGDAVAGRIGADRFAVCLPKDRFQEQKFLDCIYEIAHIVENSLYRMHIHMGVYEIEDISMDTNTMCDKAFMAIQSIKDSYHDYIAYYDDESWNRAILGQKILGEFDNALETEQFHIYIQPQISAEGTMKGGEVLVRWVHPQKGLVPPGDFIPVLEDTGLISKMDEYVWELACKQLREWKEIGREDLYLSINISPKDFYYIDVYQTLVDLVEQYEIAPENLRLEITESAFIGDIKEQLKLIHHLQGYGFLVEMDDFGSGFSSLNMLKDMTMDVLKIDMIFLQESGNEDRSRKIVTMIIALAKSLGMEVITEGVETREQVLYLTSAGCDLFQGYYFAKPMTVLEFEEKYQIR